jgi:hypothetical protein
MQGTDLAVDMERLAGWKNSISASLSNWGKTNDEESSVRIPLLGEVPPASEVNYHYIVVRITLNAHILIFIWTYLICIT